MSSMTMSADLLAQVREAEAFLKRAKAAVKEAESERKDELALLGADFITHVCETGEYKESATSAWAGFSESGIKLEVNGRPVTVSITVTDEIAKSSRVEGVDYTPRNKRA